MKNIKKILLVVLAVILTVGAALSISAATTFTDTEGHWAWTNGYIPYLVEKNVLNGYAKSDGTYYFKPDGEVTRAEFIKMLDETFGLTATKAVSYTDVKSTDWFCVYFQKAAAQGYILNYGTTADPNGKITREEAISLLVRYLDLDSTKLASSSTFSDFNTIDSKYQTYVLEAIYAGLIDGYKQSNGTYLFKPRNTLTRAESLTILYRAAGAIYNKNSYTRDAAAAATNSVITKGGVTIQDQTLTGRTIVSEGASSGIVTFSNCTIKDTLYIRGDVKVYFDKCDVENVVVEGRGGISLLNGSTIDSLTLDAKNAVSIAKGTAVDTLDVNPGATSSSVTGDGTIKNANIKAQGFTSSILPNEYEIYNKMTATFEGKEYTGSSADNQVFTVAPYASIDAANYYIELTSSVTGSVYYYYTKSATVPTLAQFDDQYRQADFNGKFSVTAGKPASAKTYTILQVKDYTYVVLMLQSGTTQYAPVIISNSVTTSDGFSVVPAYAQASNSITFKAAHAGTLSWYYTTSGNALTQNQFAEGYKNAETALKGSMTVSAASASSITLNSTYTAKNEFVALQIVGIDGTQYVPVVVSVGDTGFSAQPKVKTAGVITYTPSVTGKIYYYYSKTDAVPSSSLFLANYAAATYSGTASIIAGTAGTIAYQPAYASAYPYMIIAAASADGVKIPVCVALDYDSGFSIVPRMTDDKTISLRTSVAGTVKYYFTSSALVPSTSEFNTIYQALGASLSGTIAAPASYFDATITLPESVKSNMYAVIMMVDRNGNAYAPVVLSLKYSAASVSITGFLYDPYIKDGYLYVTPVSNGTVRYYYATAKASITPTDFYTNYSKAEFKGAEEGKANTQLAIQINTNAKLKYQAIMVSFFDGTNYSEPVSLFAFENTNTANTNTSGFTYSIVGDVVVVTPSYTGTLYYKLTDKTSDFPSAVVDTTGYTSVNVIASRGATFNTESKKYAVVLLKTASNTYSTVIIDLTSGKDYSAPTYDDGANTLSTGLSGTTTDEQNKVWKLLPNANGYMYFTIVADGKVVSYMGNSNAGNAGTKVATAGTLIEFDYSTIAAQIDTIAPGATNVSIYAQLFQIPATAYKSVTLKLK